MKIKSKKKLSNFNNYFLDHYITHQSILNSLSFHAKTNANKTAFIQLNNELKETNHITFSDLHKKVNQLAYELHCQIPCNERCILIYNNDINFIISFLACLAAGIIAVPAYMPKANRNLARIQAIASDCNAMAFLTTQKIAPQLQEKLNLLPDLNKTPIIQTDTLFSQKNGPMLTPTILNDIAFLQYTSGSTSTPKGVMVTNHNILYNCNYIAHQANINKESINLSWLPNFHDMGLFNGFLVLIYTGVTSIIMDPTTFITKPNNWLKSISKYRITHSGGPNFAYELCINKTTPSDYESLNLSRWQCAFNGAEPLQNETMTTFSNTFKSIGFRHSSFYPCYGLAEATLMVTGSSVEKTYQTQTLSTTGIEQHAVETTTCNNHKTVISSGKTTQQTAIKIVDPVTLTECSHDKIGEIWISGPTVTKGYWKKDTLTKETFQATLPSDNSLYLRSGDLGYINLTNELFVTGRLKDLIIINGRNLYPQDIEKIAETTSEDLEHHGSAAFQCSVTHHIILVAEIKRTKMKTFDSNQTKEIIQKAIFKHYDIHLTDIIFISPLSLPKTSSGKKQRKKAEEHYQNQSLKIIKQKTKHTKKPAQPLTNTEKELITIIELATENTTLSPSTSLMTIGINSLTAFDIISKINSFFAIEVSVNDFFDTETIKEMATKIDTYQLAALEKLVSETTHIDELALV
ncbi:AMP-dependent synthetase [Candidatus Marinamargulisbacteria bacterium SCGC AG-414-C22]|nr:AMP-dependent synthetase [Candidatus Marinamargulisbacteria bacterium SCGC AG-414-C22]